MEYDDCVILRSLNLPRDRIHSTMVTCGNVYRFNVFAKYGNNYREFGEFSCYKAAEIEVDGEMVLLICHGVSNSATAPILKELIEMGVKVVIRCGTAGTYKPLHLKPGDLCIVYASIRDDTSSHSEIDVRYPAVADYDVVDSLVDTSKKLGYDTQYAISYSSDLFYRRIHKTDHRDVFALNGLADVEENEMSILFLLSSLYGVKAGALITIDGYPRDWGVGKYFKNTSSFDKGINKMVQVALKTASALSKKV